MTKAGYLLGLTGALLVGALYLNRGNNKPRALYEEQSSDVSADGDIYSRINPDASASFRNRGLRAFTVPRDLSLEQKLNPVVNMNDQNLAETLADSCDSQCLFYPDEDGNVHRENNVGSVYESDNQCLGTFRDNGWLLLDKDMEPKMWGKNSNDSSFVRAEDLFDYEKCD